MKILVTGASGFIGKHLIHQLSETYLSDLTIIANASNIESLNKAFPKKNINLIAKPYDIYNNDNDLNLFEYFLKPDKLIHLAWKGLPNYGNEYHITENLPNEFNFISNLIKNGLTDLTITGTCFEYGNIEGELFENFPTDPTNFYALAKDMLRKSLTLYQNQYKFNMKWLRLFYMYGIGQNSNSIISQLDKALNNDDKIFNMSGGEQIRDYLKVEEMVNFIIKISLLNNVNEIINISSGTPKKLIDFVTEYTNNQGKKIYFNKGYYNYSNFEPMSFWGNNNKLYTLLNSKNY
jgi:nucleoside-diphosphate-sugar epimerase